MTVTLALPYARFVSMWHGSFWSMPSATSKFVTWLIDKLESSVCYVTHWQPRVRDVASGQWRWLGVYRMLSSWVCDVTHSGVCHWQLQSWWRRAMVMVAKCASPAYSVRECVSRVVSECAMWLIWECDSTRLSLANSSPWRCAMMPVTATWAPSTCSVRECVAWLIRECVPWLIDKTAPRVMPVQRSIFVTAYCISECHLISICNLNLLGLCTTYNGTRYKRPIELHHRLGFENEEMTLQMQ